jgi:excinuclease UvrABC nuclease subunit
MRTALYRHFDQAGRLLYVGISFHSIQRTMQHKHGALWFEQIRKITFEWFPTREEAESAERQAIRQESPKHNIAHAVIRVNQPFIESEAPRAWGVRHEGSGRRDGWYSSKDQAQHMVGWFCACFPSEKFQLVSLSGVFEPCRPELRPSDWEKWSTERPDWNAADEYDRRAA